MWHYSYLSATPRSSTCWVSSTNKAVAKPAQVEDQYYKKHEYDALSPEQKKILHERHEKQGHKRGAKDSTFSTVENHKPKGKPAVKTTLSMHSIQAITSAIVKQNAGADSNSDYNEEVAMQPPAKKKPKSSNHNNSSF